MLSNYLAPFCQSTHRTTNHSSSQDSSLQPDQRLQLWPLLFCVSYLVLDWSKVVILFLIGRMSVILFLIGRMSFILFLIGRKLLSCSWLVECRYLVLDWSKVGQIISLIKKVSLKLLLEWIYCLNVSLHFKLIFFWRWGIDPFTNNLYPQTPASLCIEIDLAHFDKTHLLNLLTQTHLSIMQFHLFIHKYVLVIQFRVQKTRDWPLNCSSKVNSNSLRFNPYSMVIFKVILPLWSKNLESMKSWYIILSNASDLVHNLKGQIYPTLPMQLSTGTHSGGAEFIIIYQGYSNLVVPGSTLNKFPYFRVHRLLIFDLLALTDSPQWSTGNPLFGFWTAVRTLSTPVPCYISIQLLSLLDSKVSSNNTELGNFWIQKWPVRIQDTITLEHWPFNDFDPNKIRILKGSVLKMRYL